MAAVRLAIEKPGFSKRVLHLGSPEMTKPASGGFGDETALERGDAGFRRSRAPGPTFCELATAATLCAVLMPVGQTNAPRATMAWRAIRIASSRSISVASTSLPEHADGGFRAVGGARVEGLELGGSRFAADHGAQRQVLRGRDGVLVTRVEIRRFVLQQVAEIVGLRQWAWLTPWR